MRPILLLAAFLPTTISGSLITYHACPFSLPEHIKVDEKQQKCLATTIWGESRGESLIGQRAVGYIIKNRAVKHSICDVVLAKNQFSIFNNNAALRAAAMSLYIIPKQKNSVDQEKWQSALWTAEDILNGSVKDPTQGSKYYISPIAMKSLGYKYPKWTYEFKKTVTIGNHVFYKDEKNG